MSCDVVVTLRDPDNALVLIEGALFHVSYLGSTQLTAQPGGHMSKADRMIQAHEAVGRIKVTTNCTGVLSLGKPITFSFNFSFLTTASSAWSRHYWYMDRPVNSVSEISADYILS